MSATSPSATSPTTGPAIRGRIGRDARSGHYAVPHRYGLYLSQTCPYCLQIAVTHSLLGLRDAVPVTVLPPVPDGPAGGYAALRPLYEASSHHHPGPAAAPVLTDSWTGRIVSTYAPDILRDLAGRFGGRGPDLRPCGAEDDIEAVARLCETDIGESAARAGDPDTGGAERDGALRTLFTALDSMEARLDGRAYVLGEGPTAADVQLWVTLMLLDTVHRPHLDTVAGQCVAHYPRLWAYAQRLTSHPGFGVHLDVEGVVRRYHAGCPCPAGTGTPEHICGQIVDWTAPARREAVRQPC
ncbi:glutathione S-transferase C-terminal domain-containing protein [Streptomyces sp. NPDC088725]|uniref:glutathione S-transferase C-terminal domain-containing protein n=1 Tax=Streptomyces sp. NPDC088725 TaxID=3365873 RepID=UPI0038164F9B